VWPDDLCRLFARYDTPVRAEYAAHIVDPCPQRLQYPGIPNRVPVQFVPYNGPGDAPAWLHQRPERTRVCVTWGTTTTQLAGSGGFLVPEILAGLAGLPDVEAVVAVSAADRELLPESSPQVRIVEGLPLHLLLPTCDAIIHQGGTGTMLTAASIGLPQMMIAAMPDQVSTATKVAAIGAGVSLEPDDVNTETVAAGAVTVLSDDAMRKSARLLQQEILAQPTPAEVVRTLEARTLTR
jgi:UDP:flavonoid glycosyltransferase YjiC (YdhE family)